MRATFFILFFLFVGFANGQSNLTFSRVINFKRSLGGSGSTTVYNSDTIFVPANKVWKIEYRTWILTGLGQWCNTPSGGIVSEGYRIAQLSTTSTGADTPIWLPAGTGISFYFQSGGGNSGYSCAYYYGHFFASILEFSVQ